MECLNLLLEHLARIEHQFLSGVRDSRKAGSLLGMMRGVGGVRKSIHQSWGFKGVQEEIPSERGQHSSNRVSGISTRTMHQSITPSILFLPWWQSRQFLIVPIFQTLLPVTFGYSLSLEAVVMRQLRRWKRFWRRSLTRSHKRTSRSCWNATRSALQPVGITSKGTTVSCVNYQ